MIIGMAPLVDLSIDSVLARGLPNQERVVVRATMDSYTANVGLMLGYRDGSGEYVPIADRLFWLGPSWLLAGSVMNIYTGMGQNMSFPVGNGTTSHSLFWNMPYVAFDQPEIEPILFRLGEASVGQSNIHTTKAIPGPQMALPKSLGQL